MPTSLLFLIQCTGARYGGFQREEEAMQRKNDNRKAGDLQSLSLDELEAKSGIVC